jgi:uncharacterized protein
VAGRGAPRDAPHLPRQATIDAYGKGGFAFAGMSHRGSLLCLPDGIWAWPVAATADINAEALEPVLSSESLIELFLLGAGRDPWFMPPDLRALLRERGIAVDVMATGPAVRTFNVLLGERRRVAAGLIAVE